MINVTVTTISGLSSKIGLPDVNKAKEFIAQLPDNLTQGTRVKVSCDLLGVSTFVNGRYAE